MRADSLAGVAPVAAEHRGGLADSLVDTPSKPVCVCVCVCVVNGLVSAGACFSSANLDEVP